MLVSPALEQLLRSPTGRELATRLHAHVAGTIADGGLSGPAQLLAYVGATGLRARGGFDVSAFGHQTIPSDHSPLLILLVILMVVALLVKLGTLLTT